VSDADTVTVPVWLLRLLIFGPEPEKNTPDHPRHDPERDENWEPKRWSDPTYLGDGPWGA
jgi:hypothetical protein